MKEMKAQTPEKAPRWTIIYFNTNGDYVGSCWEFYIDKDRAMSRKNELQKSGKCPIIRRYNHNYDKYMRCSFQTGDVALRQINKILAGFSITVLTAIALGTIFVVFDFVRG